ncbi:MAG: hypothetical protein IPK19_41290 [Chloroflexi bacterium]|nr:hypothetical protein [Chloroflexota bacterium]
MSPSPPDRRRLRRGLEVSASAPKILLADTATPDQHPPVPAVVPGSFAAEAVVALDGALLRHNVP